MKVAIGKINSTVYFDRDSQNVKRNSSNGHKSAYAIYKNILEIFNDIEINGVGLNDTYSYKDEKADVGFFITGIINKDDSDLIIDYINKYNIKYILYADDYRCLDSLNENTKLKYLPTLILSQFSGNYVFHNKEYNIVNFHQELSELNNEINIIKVDDAYSMKKDKVMNVLCNANAKDNTNRQLSLIDYYNYLKTKNIEFNVFGKTPDDVMKMSRAFKGSLECNDAEKKLKESTMTLCLPITSNWSTSKYIESINNYCIPLFDKTYDVPEYCKELVVESKEDLYIKYLKYSSKKDYIDMMSYLITQSKEEKKWFNYILKRLIIGVMNNE